MERGAGVIPTSVEDGNGGTVDNALRTDVHVGTSGHLAVARHEEGGAGHTW